MDSIGIDGHLAAAVLHLAHLASWLLLRSMPSWIAGGRLRKTDVKPAASCVLVLVSVHGCSGWVIIEVGDFSAETVN